MTAEPVGGPTPLPGAPVVPAAAKDAVPLVEMRDIRVAFGGVHAVEDVSIDLHAGEVVGLVGGNGAGKSTLMRVLSGARPADSGEILIEGQPATIANPRDAKALGIETIYQTLALADNEDAPANLFLGRELTTRWGTLDDSSMEDATRKVMGRLNPNFKRFSTPVKSLSGGQRQAVAIARAVHFNARILIMDEPTAALGVRESNQVLKIGWDRWGARQGGHDVGDVFPSCEEQKNIVIDGVKGSTEDVFCRIESNVKNLTIKNVRGVCGRTAFTNISPDGGCFSMENILLEDWIIDGCKVGIEIGGGVKCSNFQLKNTVFSATSGQDSTGIRLSGEGEILELQRMMFDHVILNGFASPGDVEEVSLRAIGVDQHLSVRIDSGPVARPAEISVFDDRGGHSPWPLHQHGHRITLALLHRLLTTGEGYVTYPLEHLLEDAALADALTD
jgi:D-xylose transport system ATP-binding protein